MPQRLGAPRSMRSILALLLVAALSFPLGVLASHQFADVPNGHTFHDDIGAIREAGITAGCGGSNYCPATAIDRGQMAGFLHRALGRSGSVTSQVSGLGDGISHEVASIDIQVGGTPGTDRTGFIVVTASATLVTQSAGVCPCTLGVRPDVGGVQPVLWGFTTVTDTPSSFASLSFRLGTASSNFTFAVPAGTTQTVRLLVALDTTSGTANINGALTATYVPFSNAGTDQIVVPVSAPAGNGLGLGE